VLFLVTAFIMVTYFTSHINYINKLMYLFVYYKHMVGQCERPYEFKVCHSYHFLLSPQTSYPIKGN